MEYRNMTATITPIETQSNENDDYVVEGYAANFVKYLLYEFDGVEVYEQIDRRAFDGVDLTDVILQYDHQGKVYARGSNGSLELSVDDRGLKIRADLSGSAAARELYDEIKQGLVTRMSWGFTVSEDEFDRDTRTRVIKKVKKVYDVSAVSIPANDSTSIQARNLISVLNKEQRDAQHKRLKLKLKTII